MPCIVVFYQDVHTFYLRSFFFSVQYFFNQIFFLIKNPDPVSFEPRTTTYLGYPIRQEHSIKVRARNVIRHNIYNEVTRISCVGKSGSGKTTVDTNFIHEIHTIGEEEFGINYAVRWVGKEELLNFPKFVKTLAPVDQIIVFEDISYATEMLKKIERVELKEALTTLRHQLGEIHIIFFFNFHYTKALDKMLRDADFKIFTSISDEEKPNMLQLLGYDNTKMISRFEYRHRGMLQNGWWTVKVANDGSKKFLYRTNKPFRIALYSDLGELHFLLYASVKSDRRVACNLCSSEPIGREVLFKFLWDELVRKFGPWAGPIARNWLFMKGFPIAQNRIMYSGFAFLNDFTKRNYVNLEDFAYNINGLIKVHKVKKQQRRMNKKEFMSIEKTIVSKNGPYDKKNAEKNVATYFENLDKINDSSQK